MTPEELEQEIERLWEARWLTQDAILKLRLDYEPLRRRLDREQWWATLHLVCTAILYGLFYWSLKQQP